jgi:hypothetical protein
MLYGLGRKHRTMANMITNYLQADPAPKPKTRTVSTPEITKGGEPAEWCVAQVYQAEFADWQESDQGNSDVRWLAKTLQDGNGNCVFPTVEKALSFFEGRTRSAIMPLVIASNELNFSTVKDAEKNSEPTTSEDSPSSSA